MKIDETMRLVIPETGEVIGEPEPETPRNAADDSTMAIDWEQRRRDYQARLERQREAITKDRPELLLPADDPYWVQRRAQNAFRKGTKEWKKERRKLGEEKQRAINEEKAARRALEREAKRLAEQERVEVALQDAVDARTAKLTQQAEEYRRKYEAEALAHKQTAARLKALQDGGEQAAEIAELRKRITFFEKALKAAYAEQQRT